MKDQYNLCIIKPNKSAFSETFIQEHIKRLSGRKFVLYGGAFPVYDENDHFLIKSKFGLLSYLIQKRLFGRKNIQIRTHALRDYLVSRKINIVFAEYGTVGSMVTDACMLAKVPLIIHFHGADVFHRPNIEGFKELYQKAFNYGSAFIAVSADMVKALISMGAPEGKVYNASCGVDIDAFPLVDISASKPIFLAVGRFVEKKAPLTLINAFKIVLDRCADAKLYMVGDGPLFFEARGLINKLGFSEKIVLTGVLNSEQIRNLMAQSRCFVQHSVTAKSGDSEGTPVTVLEASSSGLPVVSTYHGGIKEAVLDGVTGYLSQEHDIPAMAENMLKIAFSVDLAVKMGKAARAHMIAAYDIRDRIKLLDSIIQKYINV